MTVAVTILDFYLNGKYPLAQPSELPPNLHDPWYWGQMRAMWPKTQSRAMWSLFKTLLVCPSMRCHGLLPNHILNFNISMINIIV